MRLFFNISDKDWNSESKSCFIGSSVQDFNGENAIICNVQCRSLQATNAIIMNVVGKNIIAPPGAILYNIFSAGDIVLNENEVRVGVYAADGSYIVMNSLLSLDGGK